MHSKILSRPKVWLFLLVSFGITFLFVFFTQNIREIAVLFGVNLATLVNIFMIIFVVERLLFDSKSKKTTGLLAGAFIAKTIILLLAFIVGIHFVGDRVILSVINYAVQILVLSIFLYNYFYRAGRVESE